VFVQVIQGRTSDREGLLRQLDRWQDEIRPGATGYLGTTAGVAEDGRVFVLARFESEDAARANSDRAEQGAWWNETAKYFEGEPAFQDFTDVDVTQGGGSNDAGFVQVMKGRVSDKERLRAMEAEFMPQMAEMRPDVIGSVRGWDGDEFTEAIYFTSEAEARKGEAAMADMPQEAQEGMAEFMGLFEGDVAYLDLTAPWLR